MALGALIGTAIGHGFDGSARPLALGLLGCGVTALLLVLYSERGTLFRRLIPPGQARQNPDPGLR
jgi:DHA1 family bicyclomycin/chloramphenicol resistance-like MFS transporter